MKAAEKRELAELCLQAALKGDYKKASQIRQQAYALNPPGSIGIDWSDKKSIWEMDKRFLQQMKLEPFSDLQNTKSYIYSLQAGLFVDHIFNFRDYWAVIRREELITEKFCCPQLEVFLNKVGFALKSVSRIHVYAQTKQKNINARVYHAAINGVDFHTSWKPPYFSTGEYDLGFSFGSSEKVINARRKWLEDYAQFLEMQEVSIENFPKTFQTFQKHKLKNSEKYQNWMNEYTTKAPQEKNKE